MEHAFKNFLIYPGPKCAVEVCEKILIQAAVGVLSLG